MFEVRLSAGVGVGSWENVGEARGKPKTFQTSLARAVRTESNYTPANKELPYKSYYVHKASFCGIPIADT